MTDRELLRQAKNLRTEAHRLLYGEGLLALIGSTGETRVIGSFSLDLMTWPDIDISVELPHEKDVTAFFELGQEIASKFTVAKMSFSNHFIRQDVPFDHGLYWGIRLLHEGRIWKIDLWGYGSNMYESHMKDFDQLKSQLQDGDRMAILRIKNEVCRRPEYRGEITAMNIYRAVSQHKVRTIEEFDKWRLDNDSAR